MLILNVDGIELFDTPVFYLNTSYVDIKRFSRLKIHLILSYLNTSYVDIKRSISISTRLLYNYLNTSYVDIKLQ